ncbi:hypothetical protein EQH57_0381 [Dictyocoela roeselum]|nr:hypothetical protein EQH57_0381 [Dictyocoela roeselum]
MNYLCKTTKTPMIDGGVDNLECHVKVVINKSCLYCIKELYAHSQRGYCTLKDDRIRLIHQLSEELTNEEVVSEFNKMRQFAKTDLNEVERVLNNVVPNVCTINSVCASLMVICWKKSLDFAYFNGHTVNFNFVGIEKDDECVLCNENLA